MPDSDERLPPFVGHAGPVNSVAFSPDGSRLAAGGYGRSVQLFDMRKREKLEQLRGHADWVNGVAYDSTGSLLASCSSDHSVRIWDARTGEPLRVLRAHTDWVRGIAFQPGGSLLASASADSRVLLWNMADDDPPREVEGRHVGWVNSVAFRPDGRLLASAGDDGVVRLWNVEDGCLMRELKAHTKFVRALAFSPDGSLLASISADKSVRLWNPNTGDQAGPPIRLPGEAWARAAAFLPDGKLVLGDSEGCVRLYDPETGNLLEPFSGEDRVLIHGLAISANGSTLVATGGDDDQIRLWDVRHFKLDRLLPVHDGGIRAVAFDPKDRLLATGGSNRRVRVWQIPSGELKYDLVGHERWVNSVMFDHRGDFLASGSGDSTARLWDLRSGNPIGLPLIGHDGFVRSVAFNHGGTLLATAGADATVRLWDITRVVRGPVRTTEWDEAALADVVHSEKLPLKHTKQVNAVTFSRDGRWLASASNDRTVALWNFTTRRLQKLTGHRDRVNAVAFSPDGRLLASGGGDHEIRLWDVDSGKEIHRWKAHASWVRSVAFSGDGKLLISCGGDQRIYVWNVQDRTRSRPFLGHIKEVRAVAFSHSSHLVASAGADGTIRLWNRHGGIQIAGTRLPARTSHGQWDKLRLVGIQSDVPSDVDLLGFDKDVHILARLIAAQQTDLPLAIAVPGPWGSGKSSFLAQVAKQVEDLTELSSTLSNIGGSAFLGNIRQVHFNAWHYSDDHVWTGIAEQLFTTLAKDEGEKDPPGDAPARIAARIARLRRQEQADRELAEQYQEVLDKSERVRFRALKLAVLLIRRRGWLSRRTALIALAAAVVAAAGYPFLPVFPLVVSGVMVALSSTAAVTTRKMFRDAKKVALVTGKAKRSLTEAAEKDQRRALRSAMLAREKIARLDTLAGLTQFLRQTAEESAYDEHRGLLGVLRRHLEELSARLDAANEHWQEHPNADPGDIPVQRIVLYIDDLDRCPPRRVVDVLAAVHLMLGLKRFVVVVAVDPAWLLSCLRQHHGEVVGAMNDRSAEQASLEYLDKIFQIPYAVRGFHGTTASEYLRRLAESLPENGSEEDDAELALQAPSSDATPAATESGAPQSLETNEQPDTTVGGPIPASTDTDEPYDQLNPLGLQLRPEEAEALTRLGPLIRTPRAAKKLHNLYRLVRIGITDQDTEEYLRRREYVIVQVLLALLVGVPTAAKDLFSAIAKADTAETGIVDRICETLIASIADRHSTAAEPAGPIIEVTSELTGFAASEVVVLGQKWVPELRRYSFHTLDDAGRAAPGD